MAKFLVTYEIIERHNQVVEADSAREAQDLLEVPNADGIALRVLGIERQNGE